MVLAMLAFTWMGVLLGMLVRSPDAMQGVGFIVIFPLAFLAGTFVPIAGMDAIPRAIAQWDPISALVGTVRGLTEGVHSTGSWQLVHPELAMALWCLLIIAVCVPLALRRFNRTLAEACSPAGWQKRLAGCRAFSTTSRGPGSGGLPRGLFDHAVARPPLLENDQRPVDERSVNILLSLSRGNCASGTSTSRKRHSGSQPSLTLHTSSRSSGMFCCTCSW